jgi:hypothetical protein
VKKITTLVVLIGLLVFSVSTGVYASTIYSDIMFGAESKIDSTENDLAQHMIGIDVPISDYSKIVMEYQESTVEGANGADATSTIFLIKSGFIIVTSDLCQLHGNLSSIMLRGDSGTLDATYYPILLGLEIKYNLNERTYINGNYDYSVYGKYTTDSAGDLDANYGMAQVKLNYLFSKQNGVAFGYHWSELKLNKNGTTKTTNDGFSFGLIYQF